MIAKKGRHKELREAQRFVRAAAMGRLLLGEIHSWEDFLEPETRDWANIPRRELKSLNDTSRQRLGPEIDKFCTRNFMNMTTGVLSCLYEELKAHRGLEVPLDEFERNWAKFKPKVYSGFPRHSTVVISLWGLQFQHPEELIVNDVRGYIDDATMAEQDLASWKTKAHGELRAEREDVRKSVRILQRSVRACILACFNLLESYLNGIAWQYLETSALEALSNKSRKLLEDSSGASIRDKILKYPKIVSGKELWNENELVVQSFLDDVKPFRDSIVHPSPFKAPEKFGGYDKLRNLYNADIGTAKLALILTVEIIQRINAHVSGDDRPRWLQPLVDAIEAWEITAARR